MKQLLSLFLFLLPCLALAQYPSNGNQKITLGEQTTADGLIFRGLATDTTRKPSIDTMAYMVLDTTTNIIWHYKNATSNAWLRLNLLPSDTASMLTPYWRSGRFSGVLPVANGGTGSATQNFVDLTTTQTVGGDKTFTNTVAGARFNPTSSTASGTGIFLPLANTLGFSTNGQNKMTLDVNGNLGIGVTPSAWSDFKAIQLVAGTSFVGQGTQGEFWTNSYFAGNFRYYGNGRATRFACIDGTYRFYNTSNNTLGADATATFIELMTLNTSGNLGISENSPTEKLHVVGNARITGNIAAGVTSATARLHLAAGTATASTAPLKFTSGTNLTTAEAGAMEFNGTNLFFSPSTTRHTVNHGLTGSATLDFPSTTTLLSADLTITVTGAADGDVVSLGVPNAAVNANTSYSAWVSAANTVTVRFNNYSSGTVNPASGSFKVFVTK
jgi:hypothetical protein